MQEIISGGLKASADLKLAMLNAGLDKKIGEIAQRCLETLRAGGKIILAGNGGSAADAQLEGIGVKRAKRNIPTATVAAPLVTIRMAMAPYVYHSK